MVASEPASSVVAYQLASEPVLELNGCTYLKDLLNFDIKDMNAFETESIPAPASPTPAPSLPSSPVPASSEPMLGLNEFTCLKDLLNFDIKDMNASELALSMQAHPVPSSSLPAHPVLAPEPMLELDEFTCLNDLLNLDIKDPSASKVEGMYNLGTINLDTDMFMTEIQLYLSLGPEYLIEILKFIYYMEG